MPLCLRMYHRHRVVGLTLPPSDANYFSSYYIRLEQWSEEELHLMVEGSGLGSKWCCCLNGNLSGSLSSTWNEEGTSKMV